MIGMQTRYSFVFFIVAALVVPWNVFALTAEERAALQNQLSQVQAEITQNQNQLQTQQTQRVSLERDVSILSSKIQSAQLQIKARDLTIKQLNDGISQKQSDIAVLDSKISAGEKSLAQMLRKTQQIDDLSMAELALGGSITDLFREVDDFESVQRALQDSFAVMSDQKDDLNARKNALQDQQQETQDLRQLQVLQQQSLKKNQQEKQTLVTSAKGQEAVYKKIIAEKQQTAAQIQAALFDLRDSKAVSFGTMYTYAKEASAKTGVRPAVILAILAEESNLGQNVGTGNWKDDMNPTRDAPIFQQICAALGLNPDSMPVSKKPWYGWGGAMGPAQFIPSTWVQYQDRIANAVGQNPPNPWDARTAVFATAILMMDNGADAQTAAAERLAALRYLAGWKNASKAAYAFYGNEVMDLAAKFQGQIDVLGA